MVFGDRGGNKRGGSVSNESNAPLDEIDDRPASGRYFAELLGSKSSHRPLRFVKDASRAAFISYFPFNFV